ncbi:hypothetical protein [Methanoculleus sp. 7T]|uniref:hypothetical protein n=1 Tax=Methanoculleus sp. 7T TaxID=2937282 RepID=UPI0020BDC260|nr:hypothetical protein [Methanoculleus sp. 7T]MCK8519267.1 hypothetical protein [Methanoculleus sp. 7T]
MGPDPHEIIAQGLGITRFFCEDENAYIARILYSAISEWTKTAVLDRNLEIESDSQDPRYAPYTRHHVTRKCNIILSTYLDLYPNVRRWFYPPEKQGIQPAKIIQERLEFSGFLVSGPDNTIQLPPDKYAKITNNLYLLRGTSFGREGKTYGLGWYVDGISESDTYPIEELFLIPQTDAKTIVLKYSKFARSEYTPNTTISDARRYFDPLSRRVFSESWDKSLCHPWKATVYRNNRDDYGFAKQENGMTYTHAFPDHIVKLQEVRRFMYGFRYLNHNPERAIITTYRDAIKIKLHSALPGREEMLFYMVAWPIRNILDRTEFITLPVFLPIITNILKNLNIQVVQDV